MIYRALDLLGLTRCDAVCQNPTMKTLVSGSIALVVVALATLVAAQGPSVDPKLQEVLDALPTPGSGEIFNRTIPADVLRGRRTLNTLALAPIRF